MKNENIVSRFFSFIGKYPQRTKVVLMLVIIAVCVMLLSYEFGQEANFKKDIYYEIITGVAFTTITVFIISIFNWMTGTKEIHEMQREDTLKQIMDLLGGTIPDKKNIINDIYTHEATAKVLQNTLSRLNRRLANGYSLAVACEEDVIREDFNYNISMYQNRTGSSVMEQNLRYKRYYKPGKMDSNECYLQCGFAFCTSGLNKLLENNIYFLREEIYDANLITELTEAAKNNDAAAACRLLHLSITTTQNEIEQTVPLSKIDISFITSDNVNIGIMLRTKVDYINEDDGMRSYRGCVNFVIPAPENKRFICVFADPVVGSTKFKLRVDPKMVNDINDVEFVEILSRAGNGNGHVTREGDYGMVFQTNDTILPKSAIIAFW